MSAEPQQMSSRESRTLAHERGDSGEHALAFLYQARILQHESGKKLVGIARITSEAADRIERFIARYDFSSIDNTLAAPFREQVERLLVKFEALCLRRKFPPPNAEIADLCYRQLTKEFLDNLRTFKISPARLVIATLHAVFPLHQALQAPPLGEFVAQFPGLLHRALKDFPADPVRYLLNGYQRYQEIGEWAEKNRHPIRQDARFRLAFAAEGGSVSQRITTYLRESAKLGSDEEFKAFFANASWVIRHAVASHGANARSYLLSVKKGVEEMLADPQLSSVHHQRGSLFAAAIRKPENATQFMLSVLAQERRIEALERSTGSPALGAKKLRDLCLRTPKRAEIHAAQLQKAADRESENVTAT